MRNTLVSGFAIIAVVAHASGAVAQRAGDNPLIGKWHLSGETVSANSPGLHCPITDMIFTSRTTTSFDPDANPPLGVTYNVQPNRVVVSSGNDVIYYLLDGNHIQRDDWLKCTYQRIN